MTAGNSKQFYDVGWYFWNETYDERYGPHATSELAEEGLVEYLSTFGELP